MNKNLLNIAIAAALVAPLAAQAEVEVSGAIQAEIGTLEERSAGRQTITDSDISGNGGPNKLKFDISESLGGGLTGFARLDWEFDTFNTVGDESNFKNREKYVGLEGSMAHLKMGRIQGVYKTSSLGYDKWNSTSLQARNGGGAMSGGNFGHSSFVDDVLELGFNAGGFKGTLQYIADETYANEGSMLGALQYAGKTWEVTAAVANQEFNNSDANNMNWKLAGKANFGALYLALQYESVETAQAKLGLPAAGETDGVDAADYVFTQLGYKMGNVELIGWVGWVGNAAFDSLNSLGDLKDKTDDAISYSIGAKYHFSKRMFAYAGYHKTDSDTRAVLDSSDPNNLILSADDYYDVEAFVAGVRLGF